MIKKDEPQPSRSQTELTPTILSFLDGAQLRSPQDLVSLRQKIVSALVSRPYNDDTREHADSIQWKRTASEILEDGYVYEGKSCSDLTIVFLALCRAAGVPGQLVKLKNTQRNGTHSVAEIQLGETFYSYDIQNNISEPREGFLAENSEYVSDGGGHYTVYAKGRDVWDLGLDSIQAEQKIYQ